jgi:hypothetical protein
MIQNLDYHLTQTFPQIFVRTPGTNHQDKADQQYWGFECDSGWYQLIYDLCSEIMTHCETTGDRVPTAEQVKEKFGGMRFYVDRASEAVYNIIDRYESRSYKVCETCGEPGHRRLDLSWIHTLCDHHYEIKRGLK